MPYVNHAGHLYKLTSRAYQDWLAESVRLGSPASLDQGIRLGRVVSVHGWGPGEIAEEIRAEQGRQVRMAEIDSILRAKEPG